MGGRDGLDYFTDMYEALNGAEALAVMTEWDIYRQPDFSRVKALMTTPIIIDGRNIYNPAEMKRRGFTYISIGRPDINA